MTLKADTERGYNSPKYQMYLIFSFLTSSVSSLVTMLIDNFPCDPRRRIEPNLVGIKPARTKLHHE